MPLTMEEMMQVLKIYDDKLKELMSEDDYDEFSQLTAKALFLHQIQECQDPDFKNFALEHFDEITNINLSNLKGGDLNNV